MKYTNRTEQEDFIRRLETEDHTNNQLYKVMTTTHKIDNDNLLALVHSAGTEWYLHSVLHMG